MDPYAHALYDQVLKWYFICISLISDGRHLFLYLSVT